MFTEKFWQQTVLVFTRISQDPKTKMKRETNNKMTDKEYGQDYIELVERQFPNSRQKGLKFLCLDSLYDRHDVDETRAFQTSMSVLGNMLNNSPPLLTENVRKVETQSQELKRKMKEPQEDRDKMEKEMLNKFEKLAGDNKASIDGKERQIMEFIGKFEESGYSADGVVTEIVDTIGVFTESEDTISPFMLIAQGIDAVMNLFG